LETNKDQRELVGKWIFSSAKWERFKYLCEIEMDKIDLNEEIEEIDKSITTTILQVAKESIPKSKGKMKRKAVAWWTEECGKIVQERNKEEVLRRTHNFQNLIKYKETQAKARRIIRKAKKQSWQTFCNKIGRTTPVGDVWNMIKGMQGIRREWKYPILKMGEEAAVSDQEKAEMIVKAFTLILLERREDSNSIMDAPITMEEMRRAIKGSGLTSPGKDDICYVMIEHL